MAVRPYKFTDFVDLLLFALYEADRQGEGAELQNLNVLAKTIKGDVPRDWVFDAAKVLETRALARCVYTFGGTFAKISGDGRLYVEDERGFTGQAQQSPGTYYNVNVTGSNNQVVTGDQVSGVTQQNGAVSPAAEMLEAIIKQIDDDQTVPNDTKTEVKQYANLIKFEVAKREPNRTLIATLLEPLSKIASIAGNVSSFIRLFDAAAR